MLQNHQAISYLEWESSAKVLGDDCNEAFNRSEDRMMHDDGMMFLTAVCDIVQVESNWQLEI